MADPPPAAAPAVELTASQERLMSIIRDTANNIFLTGDADTGKTFVIEVAKRHLASAGKLYETVAFTGSAAFNANGNTVHAAFHPMPFIPGATPDDRGSTLARSLPELLYQRRRTHALLQVTRRTTDEADDTTRRPAARSEHECDTHGIACAACVSV